MEKREFKLNDLVKYDWDGLAAIGRILQIDSYGTWVVVQNITNLNGYEGYDYLGWDGSEWNNLVGFKNCWNVPREYLQPAESPKGQPLE